ncbi:Vacuolar sorting-associated 21 [Chlorella sorokiniana]|uniref:Vacuolar sorting-associated 21 n=1 Tax=Chlorella sorokiniana TaxID=3076 RepID=A0A2P6TTH9_CHLSO|nr:Vacuolar sorting-associated 21 [Chlorella sorokiniana]|eukprot:PRW57365.1 Vacuolar sorting-associated 21 [Chlorella sorokiniana]
MSEEGGRILLVGDRAVGKRQLLAAIGASSANETALAAAHTLLRFDTKYYTADARVELRHIHQCADLQLGDGTYEAVLLVFDVSRQPSFEAVRAWFEGAGGSDADLPIRLAVGTGLHRLPRDADGQPAKPLWLAEAEEWCADQLVEFVETDEEVAGGGAAEAAGGAQGLAAAAGDSSEGASGAARVREALEAHMWPGMQMKAAPRHGAAAIAAAAAAEADEAEAAAAAAVLQRQQQQGQAAAQANDTSAVEDAFLAAANGAPANGQAAEAADEDFSFSRYLQAPEAALATAAAGGAGSGTAAAGAGPEAVAGGEEGEVEQLERLFAQVAGHRERLAALPDEQRREQAAALVVQLMAAMGFDDEEEGDEP